MPTYLLLLAAVTTVMPACQRDGVTGANDVSREPAAVLRRGNGGDPQSLDPSKAEDVHAFNVLGDLYEGLVTL
ncbi:MAG: hypothetical protein OEU40_15460, partial [Gammaproteobacteria bacterium]|nr:hypothetical protein [Gammaproteobacteria bacterium]